MASLKSNAAQKERRTLHALIALCLLVAAQINLLLHPDAGLPKAHKTEAQAEVIADTPREVAVDSEATMEVTDAAGAGNDVSAPPPSQFVSNTVNPNAFELLQEGNHYVNKRAQGKIIQMISMPNEDGLKPRDWRIIYYDDAARFNAVEVQFSNGQITKVFEPSRVFQWFSRRSRKPMREDLLQIDSDRALNIALRRTGLSEETAEKSELKLETGEDGVPVWKINFWGRVQDRPSNLGEVVISAVDGTLIKNRIKAAPVPDRLTDATPKVSRERTL